MIIPCQHGIKLHVNKLAEVRRRRNRREARTVEYSYHATSPKGDLLRYDNIHRHPGHSTRHHKHVFNGTGHEVAGSPFDVGEEGWPNMHEVIQELIEKSNLLN